jgi:hypothetical protein
MTIVFLYFCRPNEIYSNGHNVYMVVVAQLVRASDCDSEGRGFEPPRLPTKFPLLFGGLFFGMVFEICTNDTVQNVLVYRLSLPVSGKSGLTKHYSNSYVYYQWKL